MQTPSHWRPGLIVAFLASAALAGCARTDNETPAQPVDTNPASQFDTRLQLNRPMPEFEQEAMAGGLLASETLSGKLTIVNFWATWCGPCVVEIPDLVALYDEWSDREFEIVGVSMDMEGFDIVRPFAEDFQINYPIIIDDGSLAEKFGGVYALPTTFLVDGSGTIVYRFIGLFPFDEMKSRMEELMREAEAS